MPIINFHLTEGLSTPEQDARLLREASQLYVDVLYPGAAASTMDRVRAFITVHRADQFAAVGDLVSNNGKHAPFFDFIVLDGRPLDERHQLLKGFTDLLVDILKVDRSLIRGTCRRIPPEDWAIAGVPASVLRADELKARADAAAKAGA